MKFHWIYSLGSDRQYISIASDNGLVPPGKPNVDIVQLIYALPSLNVLNYGKMHAAQSIIHVIDRLITAVNLIRFLPLSPRGECSVHMQRNWSMATAVTINLTWRMLSH